MWRVVTSTFAALTLVSSVAAAQQPCTTDANRVVAEVYRHVLERGTDAGAQTWVRRLANGQINVRELVRGVAQSQEYMQRFGRTEAGEGQPYERAIAGLYRHLLGRQPDPSGLRHWTNQAQQRGLAAVVDEFVNSSEYTNKFGDWGIPGSGGLRFCENGSTTSSSELIAPRFRGMDRNNDGVITRREWQGTNAAFDNQDFNGDNRLSGDELRAEGRGRGRVAAGYDFDGLDNNNNNRIERREWQARLAEFDRLDVNGDNFLTRAEVEGTAGSAGVGTSGRFNPFNRSIAVHADRSWTDTGINLNAGDTVTISADGQIRLAQNTRDVVGAAGADARVADATIPNAPIGGLVARFGDSAPMFIGQSRTMRVPRSGRLYLGPNDSYFEDNTGAFNARVSSN
jgi:Ca2+-binding EF-hand superfamily protein